MVGLRPSVPAHVRERDPYFACPRRHLTSTCAAFCKESRMKFVIPTNLTATTPESGEA